MTVIDMTFVLNAGHQNSNLFVYNSSDTTTLRKNEVPYWCSWSSVTAIYCEVLTESTQPARHPVPTLHCTQQSSLHAGRIRRDIIGSSLHSNMQANEKKPPISLLGMKWGFRKYENLHHFIIKFLLETVRTDCIRNKGPDRLCGLGVSNP